MYLRCVVYFKDEIMHVSAKGGTTDNPKIWLSNPTNNEIELITKDFQYIEKASFDDMYDYWEIVNKIKDLQNGKNKRKKANY